MKPNQKEILRLFTIALLSSALIVLGRALFDDVAIADYQNLIEVRR